MEAFERLRLIRERLGFDAPEFAARLGYSKAGIKNSQRPDEPHRYSYKPDLCTAGETAKA